MLIVARDVMQKSRGSTEGYVPNAIITGVTKKVYQRQAIFLFFHSRIHGKISAGCLPLVESRVFTRKPGLQLRSGLFFLLKKC